MTYQELVNNINKSRRQSNYTNIVRRQAYYIMTRYNDYIKELQATKQYYIKENIITNCLIKIYSSKSKKYVYFTRYTKIPKYRTYRQQLAITYRQLEKIYDKYLQMKREDLFFQKQVKERKEQKDTKDPFAEYSDIL